MVGWLPRACVGGCEVQMAYEGVCGVEGVAASGGSGEVCEEGKYGAGKRGKVFWYV